jgi:hypothetical protein
VILALALMIAPAIAGAQQSGDPPTPSQHHHPDARVDELLPTREASGTAWQPDNTPMDGGQQTWGAWHVMLHGVAFAQFLVEPVERHRTGGFSTHQFSVVNWGMIRARRAIGDGRVGLRGMVSVEPWSVPGCGYINLLATGEMCDGDTIHDRQHPHELFMEIGADYDRALRGAWRWQLYGGLAGEPALGPVGFPHRTSAMMNPIAPIAHHWLDSSHIAFGVVTAGVYERKWKLEGSVFNGREPDENRADLDLGALDSVSGRVSYVPTDRLAVQVSAGHLTESELEFPPQPRSDVDRGTASVMYQRPLANGGFWASTIAYGVNAEQKVIPEGSFYAVTHALLAETNVAIRDRDTWFGRAEIVGKPAEDLHAHEFPTAIFTVAKLQIGYARTFGTWKGLSPGIGGTASISIVPPELASRYEGRVAPGFGVFFVVRPARHVM